MLIKCSQQNLRLDKDLLIKRAVLYLAASFLLLVLVSLAGWTPSYAQALNKHKITAFYLYNFAKNIKWPNEPGMASFDIGLYGSDTEPLYAELALLANNVKLRNLPITVNRVNTVKSLSRYHLVYVDQANSKTISDIYDALEGKPTLLVTAEYTNKQLVMINLLTEGDRLRFEVNKSNIINHGLNPLPELILNGGTEIDVAKLYREGQASLISLQKQLQVREKTLNELAAAIQTQETLNTQLENQLAQLNQSISKSDALIASQNIQMESQHAQIEAGKHERIELIREVEERTRELDNQQRQLQAIAQEIDVREKRLAYLNDTIQLQETEIFKQKEAIAGLDETVDTQKTALMYSWGLVVLGVLLIVTVFFAYSVKRRDNQRLAAHSQDLQFAKDRLAIAKRKAEDASRAKSDFLSLMSHELRTPLQAIIGYTEVVIEELKFADDNRHISDLTRVISNSERLLKLINGVLDLAKIESGKMELDLTEVKLSSLVEEALGTVAPLLEKSAIRLSRDVDDGDFLPIADPEKLLHILINLLGNASKFAGNSDVLVRAYHEPNRIYLSVADTGIGLTPEQQEHIFDPFKQADSGTTRKFQGSGLGLSITRQLCEMMGGTIEVESKLGAGATFIVDLPLPIKFSPPAGVALASGARGAKSDEGAEGQHLVMIDDDPVYLEMMTQAMVQEGFKVHTAGNAEAGLSLLRTVKPRVVTLDLLLPDQHAWLLLEKMKADPELQEIPVIIISLMDERKHVYKRAADEYLVQPLRREALKLAIHRLTDSKE